MNQRCLSESAGLGDEEIQIPDWHKFLVRERLVQFKKDPDTAMDFDSAMEEIDDIRAYDAAKAEEDEIISFDQAVNEIEIKRNNL